MKRNLLLLLLCGAFAACSGGEQATNENQTSSNVAVTNSSVKTGGGGRDADAVSVSVEEVQVEAGGSGEAVVRVEIANGFHVNANPPSNKYLIGTRLELAPAENVRAGAPVYPKGLLKKFAFEKEPLSVYEGAALIKLPLSVEARAAKGRRMLPAKVEVQPCNDQACFPPRTLDAAIFLTIN